MASKNKSIYVTQSNPEDPVPVEIIAESIVKIGKAMDSIRLSGINRRAIIVLLADSSGVSRTQIKSVLDSLESLREDYLAKPSKK